MDETGQTEYIGYGYSISYKEQERETVIKEKVMRFLQNESEVKSIMTNKDYALLQPYCENDMKQLKIVSRSIFMNFNEPLSNADYDEFYSIANMTLW